MNDTVTCMFTCHVCKNEKVKFTVRKRRDDEDVIHYTNHAVAEAQQRHMILILFDCPATKVDLYLPFDQDSGRVGA